MARCRLLLGGSALLVLLGACAGGPKPLSERDALIAQYARLRVVSPEEGAVVSSGTLDVEVDLSDVVADLSEIEAFEISLDGAGGDTVLVETFERAGALFSFGLSLIGASDNREYRLVIRPVLRTAAPDALPWSGERRWRLSLMLPTPEPLFPPEGATVLGTRTELRWDGPAGTTYRLEIGRDASFSSAITVTTEETRFVPEEPFAANRDVYWRVSSLSDLGIAGTPGPVRRFRPSLDSAPRPPFPGSVPAIVAEPRIRWSPMIGAAVYEVEISAGGAPVTVRTADAGITLDTDFLSRLFSAGASERIAWRVRAESRDGEVGAWSDTQYVVYKPLAPATVPVVEPDTIVRFAPPGDADASITLTRPFAMARTEVTNALVAEIATFAIRRGAARIVDNVLVDAVTGTALLGLDDLTLGRQFGLRAGPGNRSVIVSDVGRAGHPAVGVSWYGAIAIANALSFAAGLDPAYAGGRRVRSADGYRLPTEAEWAYALSLAFPSGFDAAGYSGGRVNFFRSGDAFESVREPYTQNGGPTTPVARLSNGGPVGIYDLLGNAWEWCDDWYTRGSFPPPRGAADPSGPVTPEVDAYGLAKRVVRGGAWNTRAPGMTPSARGSFPPEATSHSVGVRLVVPIR